MAYPPILSSSFRFIYRTIPQTVTYPWPTLCILYAIVVLSLVSYLFNLFRWWKTSCILLGWGQDALFGITYRDQGYEAAVHQHYRSCPPIHPILFIPSYPFYPSYLANPSYNGWRTYPIHSIYPIYQIRPMTPTISTSSSWSTLNSTHGGIIFCWAFPVSTAYINVD